ncbi:MAG: hypothetical protein NZ903_02760, partial [Candidatus Micrarchaeota archaeon]|nr:hypothetical protein [Candidatus Micrarchaeota archaeon]
IPLTNQAFQNMILYDLSASKKTLERLNQRLDAIKEAGKSAEFKTKISSEISLIRKEIEKLANKLENIEKQLIQKGIK